ncbi:hypothetical protein BH24PSE2_BH24PSE2_04320 [soil metagenome]
MKTGFEMTSRLARRIVVGIVGTTVLLVGIALLVLPGPAVVVIPIGLGILGLEFTWARRWLRKFKEKVGDTARVVRNGGDKKHPDRPAREDARE